jgi:CubicO group peptidase (beta-lactamase class C family)
VAALQDRGHVLMFQPNAAEVHRKAGTWFDDPEIYQWFGADLHRAIGPSMRHYVRARELKAAGMDWTDVLAAEDENRRARLAAELLASDGYGSTAAQVRAFVERGGGCMATFFNYRTKRGNGPGLAGVLDWLTTLDSASGFDASAWLPGEVMARFFA